ncbi:VIT-domain-containing protein [Tuber magnatum]|uniref:VIT-domain-containing protein n=1 Tax=Tuber magnatum TaxID=42249 RepID=A0A317SD51_9PEZI|nr:VIT-domain-containing protein [Tuber magnatum]
MTARVTHVDNGCLQSLPLISTTLRSHIVDLTVSHTLTQVYSNSSARDISEALYTFPLYESSSVTGFQALVGEKTIRGVAKERAEAKAIYEAAKSAGKVTALFSQDTSEVFTTGVGNIPAGGLVVVVIKYAHELKQDIEVDGVKLVIPTVIAPKYGNVPVTAGLVLGDRWRSCWGNFSQSVRDIGSAEDAGVSLSITATMSGPIRDVASPSHPISVGFGSHSSADGADFNPTKAHATLALASRSLTGLDKDFSLLIKVNNIGDPRAFLAPHPTLKDTSTLMVTMVPKLAPPWQDHEIIFVVDRSGSMEDKIATVRSALQLFLSSLPVGLHFNICSFGSNHSFLWPRSEKYSEVSLNAAKAHAMGLDSDMGGTEILQAMVGAMKTRRREMRTEFLILTDGEVWDAESVFGFINESSKDGNVRYFSLGVGDTVSHSLVEGISRAGRGYSQIVNIASNLQKKVMRMLKAALTPHVNDREISWVGKPEKQCATLTPSAPRTVAPNSLFGPGCDPGDTSLAPPSSALTLTLPKVIQAPTIIPGLFSYSRTTVYFLISNGDRPEKVFLKSAAHVASSDTVYPHQIEIPVQAITSPGASLGLYQLAGRKLLQDLEEGRLSYLEGIYDKAKEPAKHAELIAKEGTRVGVGFGLASRWTSFVAAVTKGKSTGKVQASRQVEERADVLTKGETQAANFGSASSSSQRARHSKSVLGSGSAAKRVSASPRLQSRDHICQQKQVQQGHRQAQEQQLPRGRGGGFDGPSKLSGSPLLASPIHKKKLSSPIPSSSLALSPSSPRYNHSSPPGTPPASRVFTPTSPRHAAVRYPEWIPEEPRNLVSDLATLPQFNGMFKADERIFALLDLRNRGLENAHADADFVTTVAVIIALENKFPELLGEWELMISKAKEEVQKLYSEGDREAVALAVRAALGM